MWTRRDVLHLGLGPLALARAPGRAGARRGGQRPPAYVLFIVLGGGIDAVYTTDPKTRGEVEPDIDVPYEPSDIIATGNLRLGPHLAPLAPWAGRLAIVNNVQVRTAGHEPGFNQLLRMRMGHHARLPTLLEVIGEARDDQPIGCITLGDNRVPRQSPSPKGLGGEALLRSLDDTAPAELELMARALRRQSARLEGGGREAAASAVNLREAAALVERLSRVPAFRPAAWPAADGAGRAAALALQRALWIFENDLGRCVQLNLYRWDTHFRNRAGQAQASQTFFPLLARFLSELDSRRNGRGALGASTLVLLASELGRYPRLNGFQGKDHFPEAPMLFLGAGIRVDARVGSYGRTGRQMQARPVCLETGRDRRVGGAVLDLDDIGATLLHIAGIAPRPRGYFGRVVEFLVEA
jgi:uncharacterized protein (DUF1501 family)